MTGQTQRVSTGYVPRKFQAELHNKLRRFNVLVMHRRFGKTVFGVNETIDQGLRLGLNRPELPNPKYAYLAPLRDQAKRIAWDYFKTYTGPIPGMSPNEQDLRIDIPRQSLNDNLRFMLLGGDNYVSLKGIYLDGAILDEFGEMHPGAWREAIRPTLSDRIGWTIFSGTPKGRNHFYEMYKYATESGDPDWYGAILRADETGIIPEKELLSARKAMTEEEYEQEYNCSFQAGLIGAYYSKEIVKAEQEHRITEVPFDPSIPLNTFWDLGMNDTTAIWFHQRVGRKNIFPFYMEAPDLSIPEWVNRVLETTRRAGCSVGDVVLPHDAAARDPGTGKTRESVFRKLFGKRPTILKREDILEGINAARMVFSQCWFDKKGCEKGINALMNYQRRWDSKANVFSSKPSHNWASNGADAFRTFAMGITERTGELRQEMEQQYEADTRYNPYAVG